MISKMYTPAEGGIRIEQISIRQFIAGKTKKIENTYSLISNSISLLQEYRSALISAAVTGKIDVRGYPLPEAHS
ncbi:MAG: hypothetical protein V1862_09130 [Methanobacteriota archaeon]